MQHLQLVQRPVLVFAVGKVSTQDEGKHFLSELFFSDLQSAQCAQPVREDLCVCWGIFGELVSSNAQNLGFFIFAENIEGASVFFGDGSDAFLFLLDASEVVVLLAQGLVDLSDLELLIRTVSILFFFLLVLLELGVFEFVLAVAVFDAVEVGHLRFAVGLIVLVVTHVYLLCR